MMENEPRHRTNLRLLAPLFLFAGISFFAAPIFHPNNTCADWLMKWGQLSADRIWIPIHQVASLGFALGAATLFLFAIVGPRQMVGLCGGAAATAGFGMMSMLTLIHATSVSVLGAAYNSATTTTQRESARLMAMALVSYDVAVEGVAAVLLSTGLVMLALYLFRIEAISAFPVLVLAGDGSIWAVQYFRLLRVFHYGFPEWVPYTSLGLWLCAVGVLLAIPQKAPRLSGEVVAAT